MTGPVDPGWRGASRPPGSPRMIFRANVRHTVGGLADSINGWTGRAVPTATGAIPPRWG
jgi:hypothetical protein